MLRKRSLSNDFAQKLSSLGFQLLEPLGKGAYATVFRCREIITGKEMAAKIVDLKYLALRKDYEKEKRRLHREVKILRELAHTNIVKMYAVTEASDCLVIIMEMVEGKELFDIIIQHKKLAENHAAILFRQILLAINYLHRKNILHRDIKPENVLVPDGWEDGELPCKLIDFGLSKSISQSQATTFVGTPEYFAPEVDPKERHGPSYGKAADVWSCGILLFVMLAGHFPSFEKSNHSNPVVKLESMKGVSTAAKNLVASMLQVDPTKRCTLENALKSPWLLSHDRSTSSTGSGTEIVTMAGNEIVSIEDVTEDHTPTKPPLPEIICVPNTVVVPEKLALATTPIKRVVATTSSMQGKMNFDHMLQLQRDIAGTLKLAYTNFSADAIEGPRIRMAAVSCREQLNGMHRLMLNLNQTASSVLDMYKDINMAITEGVPQLAMKYFESIRKWIGRGKELTHEVLSANQVWILKINEVVGHSIAMAGGINPSPKKRKLLPAVEEIKKVVDDADGKRKLTSTEVMQLWYPFDGSSAASVPVGTSKPALPPATATSANVHTKDAAASTSISPVPPEKPRELILQAVSKLETIDGVLQEMSSFWSNLEVTVQLLLQKTDLVENLAEYAQNERLRELFLERMQQYMGLWNYVGTHCRQYIDRISSLKKDSYSFLSHSTSAFAPPMTAPETPGPEIVAVDPTEPDRAPSFP